MAIRYTKLLALLKEKGVTSYKIRQDKVIGQASWKKVQENGNIDMRTVDNLCAYLHCQPGDILEYVPSDNETEGKPTTENE